MKKSINTTLVCMFGFLAAIYAQTIEESNTTMMLDLQPVLELNINGSGNINFIFDETSEYLVGIVKYGATTLSVNSTVNWDLYAVGYSAAGTIWEQQTKYDSGADPNAENVLSLHALELHQDKVNAGASGASPFTNADYSSPFTPIAAIGKNCIYTSANPYVKPLSTDKYIAGHYSTSDFITGGSYLINNNPGGGNYYYVIDYRIKPGLPAIFPNAGTNFIPGIADGIITPGHYLQPGIYSCSIKYILTENN